jgi:hypothetical protein
MVAAYYLYMHGALLIIHYEPDVDSVRFIADNAPIITS